MPIKLILIKIWERVSSSFWFVPTWMATAAIGLAYLNLYLDIRYPQFGDTWHWWTVETNETAQSLLSTIAGSMVTVAGVTFSVVIVALTLAASQFGPRLLVGFMQDKGNQLVLGTFVSVFIYCLVVLVNLPDSNRVPQLSVLTGVLIAILAVGVLIYFFHHISTSIQAGELVREAGRALDRAIDLNLPDEYCGVEPTWPPEEQSSWTPIPSRSTGYLSRLDADHLLELTTDHDLKMLVVPQGGDFVLEGQPIAQVQADSEVDDDLIRVINQGIPLESKRENCDDLPLAVDRLTEIAVRGLSPGINDPYTAINALHQLTAGLQRILDRLPASQEFEDKEGTTRVYLHPPEGEELLDRAFGPILNYGRRDARVLAVMVEGLRTLTCNGRNRWHSMIADKLDKVARASETGLELEADQTMISEMCRAVREGLTVEEE